GPLVESGDEHDDNHGDDNGNENGGGYGNKNGNGDGTENGNGNENGGGNGNRNHNMNFRGFMLVAQECTFQYFLKFQPLNFTGIEGVVGLTRWFKKMETMNEIQKMEAELWNLTVKGNDLTAYTNRFQELILFCTRMVSAEEDRVERLKDAIRIANHLMDKKLKGYAAKNAENKRRFESNRRDNRGQKPPPFKRQNVGGQNVARTYTAGNNERKAYAGNLPYCNKCRQHHEGPCMVRCSYCKKVGHMTRDCMAAVVPNS
ncbi:putative reverse transcriptase domain-containing protein, partial [Tanacetum coccineum]